MYGTVQEARPLVKHKVHLDTAPLARASLSCVRVTVMAEAMDVFADGLTIFVGTYGCALHFLLSAEEAHKTVPPDQLLGGSRVATIRMTPQFAKSMVFFIREHIRKYESENGDITIPERDLKRLVVGEELQRSWDHIWGYTQ